MKKTDYKMDWQTYAYSEENMMTSDEEITEFFRGIDLTTDRFSSGGIPLYVSGNTAYVNPENENTIIYGETGSKKTRTAILPLIATTAGARESAFITDVKGELSANKKMHNYLEKCGIKTVYLDFRDFSGDGYNLLSQPFRLYLNNEKDKADIMVRRLITALNKRYDGSSADPFWALSAEQYLLPLMQIILAFCAQSEELYDMVNMLSVNAFVNSNCAFHLRYIQVAKYLEKLIGENSQMMLSGVASNPDKTLDCIISTVQSIIQDFTLQKDLLSMLSDTTFDVAEMYEQPTFVFLIVPDETSTYDTISGIMLDLFYNELIETYNRRYQNKAEPPCRINYICDEFCNLRINDMRSKISASRSRNIRWFLVCQSEKQLNSVYSEEAGTIIGNCKNIFFLQSSDTALLDHMADLCGPSGIIENDENKPLVSRQMLKNMKKEWEYKEALFIRDNVKYFAILPDIDAYDFLKPYFEEGAYTFEKRFRSELKYLTIEEIQEAALEYGRDLAVAENEEKQRRLSENNNDDSEDDEEDETEDYDDDDYDYEDEDDNNDNDYVADTTETPDQYEEPIPDYIDPDCGMLTSEQIAENNGSDILPPEAVETMNRKLSALFGGTGDETGAPEE